jgi:hypothetical protein
LETSNLPSFIVDERFHVPSGDELSFGFDLKRPPHGVVFASPDSIIVGQGRTKPFAFPTPISNGRIFVSPNGASTVYHVQPSGTRIAEFISSTNNPETVLLVGVHTNQLLTFEEHAYLLQGDNIIRYHLKSGTCQCPLLKLTCLSIGKQTKVSSRKGMGAYLSMAIDYTKTKLYFTVEHSPSSMIELHEVDLMAQPFNDSHILDIPDARSVSDIIPFVVHPLDGSLLMLLDTIILHIQNDENGKCEVKAIMQLPPNHHIYSLHLDHQYYLCYNVTGIRKIFRSTKPIPSYQDNKVGIAVAQSRNGNPNDTKAVSRSKRKRIDDTDQPTVADDQNGNSTLSLTEPSPTVQTMKETKDPVSASLNIDHSSTMASSRNNKTKLRSSASPSPSTIRTSVPRLNYPVSSPYIESIGSRAILAPQIDFNSNPSGPIECKNEERNINDQSHFIDDKNGAGYVYIGHELGTDLWTVGSSHHPEHRFQSHRRGGPRIQLRYHSIKCMNRGQAEDLVHYHLDELESDEVMKDVTKRRIALTAGTREWFHVRLGGDQKSFTFLKDLVDQKVLAVGHYSPKVSSHEYDLTDLAAEHVKWQRERDNNLRQLLRHRPDHLLTPSQNPFVVSSASTTTPSVSPTQREHGEKLPNDDNDDDKKLVITVSDSLSQVNSNSHDNSNEIASPIRKIVRRSRSPTVPITRSPLKSPSVQPSPKRTKIPKKEQKKKQQISPSTNKANPTTPTKVNKKPKVESSGSPHTSTPPSPTRSSHSPTTVTPFTIRKPITSTKK